MSPERLYLLTTEITTVEMMIMMTIAMETAMTMGIAADPLGCGGGSRSKNFDLIIIFYMDEYWYVCVCVPGISIHDICIYKSSVLFWVI